MLLFVFQAHPLYLGLPPGPLPCLLRLLLLQCDAGDPAVFAHILGLPNSPDGEEVPVWHGNPDKKRTQVVSIVNPHILSMAAMLVLYTYLYTKG